MTIFCRHNRFEANCPICSKEKAAAAPSASPSRVRSPSGPKRTASGGTRRSTAVRTRQLSREADDGLRTDLVPGIRGTADAERLARALAAAAQRLEPPGPWPEVATEPDLDRATELAFALAAGGEAALPAFREWAARAGSPSTAMTGEATWTPQRRFARLFERLALPGFGRAPRYDLLAGLGAAGRYELEADGLHLGGEDPTTVAAKRALVSGDVLLLERRARALADAAGLPIAALDRGLADWNAPGALAGSPPGADEPDERLDAVRRALGL